QRHELAEHVVGGLVDTHVIAEALRHLLDAVESFENRDRHRDLRLLPGSPLKIASDEQVERLIRSTQLDVGAQRDGIVRLRDRIQELMKADRATGGVPRRKVLALE